MALLYTGSVQTRLESSFPKELSNLTGVMLNNHFLNMIFKDGDSQDIL